MGILQCSYRSNILVTGEDFNLEAGIINYFPFAWTWLFEGEWVGNMCWIPLCEIFSLFPESKKGKMPPPFPTFPSSSECTISTLLCSLHIHFMMHQHISFTESCRRDLHTFRFIYNQNCWPLINLNIKQNSSQILSSNSFKCNIFMHELL